MKKRASDLEVEAFIRGREDAAEQKPGHAGLHAPFRVFYAADFGFADSNALNGSIHHQTIKLTKKRVESSQKEKEESETTRWELEIRKKELEDERERREKLQYNLRQTLQANESLETKLNKVLREKKDLEMILKRERDKLNRLKTKESVYKEFRQASKSNTFTEFKPSDVDGAIKGQEPFAKGGYGYVYKAELGGRSVAIKIPKEISLPQERLAFDKEHKEEVQSSQKEKEESEKTQIELEISKKDLEDDRYLREKLQYNLNQTRQANESLETELNRLKTKESVYEEFRQWVEDQASKSNTFTKFEPSDVDDAIKDQKPFAKGGYGNVYKAELVDRSVAIKIPKEGSPLQEKLAFDKEVEILKRIRHAERNSHSFTNFYLMAPLKIASLKEARNLSHGTKE